MNKVEILKQTKAEEFWNRYFIERGEFKSPSFFGGTNLKKQGIITSQRCYLPNSDVDKVFALCNNSNILIHNFYALALSILLEYYEEDIVFLSPQNSLEKDNKSSKMFFLDPTIDWDKSFKELFADQKGKILKSSENALNWETIVEKFQNNNKLEGLTRFGLFIGKKEDQSERESSIQVIFKFVLDDNRPFLDIKVKGEMYAPELLDLVGDNFCKLLNEIINNIYEPIKKLKYLGKKEAQILDNINKINPYFSLDKNIVELIDDQKEKRNDKVAIVHNKKQITYGELYNSTNKYSRYLNTSFSVERESLFGIMMPRSITMIEMILSVWKSGNAYVPLGVDLPDERLIQIIKGAKLSAIITDDDQVILQLTRLKVEIPIIDIRELDSQIKILSGEQVENKITQDTLAYVIYTSGSTGIPKGVMIEHLGMLNHAGAKIRESQMDENSILAQNAPHTFDISIWQFFSPLLVGGTTIIYDKEYILDVPKFVSGLVKDKITILELVPSYLLETLQHFESLEKPSSLYLKSIILNAETLTKQMVKRWLKLYPNIPIANTYGATEVSDDTSHYFMTEVPESYSVPVMKNPIQNFEVHIIDSKLSKVPIGVQGEIILAGPCVGRGYLNDKEKTEASFLKGPISGVTKQKRAYKTGDLGKFMPDGTMEFIGRNDNQVKILGHRIELGAIENIASSIEGVNNCIAIANIDRQFIALYYTSEIQLDNEILEAELSKKLPKYMLPKVYIHLKEFPLNRNGKVDKKSLPDLDMFIESSTSDYQPPNNEIQERMVSSWKHILEIQKIGITDNFFDLGGHSLKLIRLKNEYHRLLNVKIEIKEFFDNPTIELQYELIKNSLRKEEYIEIPKIEELSSYPISFAQRRLWIQSQTQEGGIAYNMPFHTLLHISNLDFFISSIDKVIDRHEILRTVFKENEKGEICQWILSTEELGFEVSVEDFRKEENKEELVSSYITSNSLIPFDLKNGPLLRASLIQISDVEYIFYYNLHHIISDGWSMEILSQEVLQYYEGYLLGKPIELPSLRIQYKDYTLWQLSELLKDSNNTHRDYWNGKLQKKIPVIEFPNSKARPAQRSYEGEAAISHIPRHIVLDIKKFIKHEGGSLFMALLSACKVLLHRYTGEEDLVIGNPVAGRDHADLEDQIGFYINIIALRNRVNPQESFKEFYNRLKQETIQSFNHQMYPFDSLLEDLDITRDMSRNPIFDILVDYHVSIESPPKGIEPGESRLLGETMVKYDLEFHFTEISEGIEIQLAYNTDLYDSSFIKQFLHHFHILVGSIFQGGSDSLIGDLDYLGETGLSDLLSFSGSQDTIEVSGSSILDLFREQVSSTPDLAALLYQKKSYSYRELDLISDQLAVCLLSDYKVNKGDIISLKQDRNDWLVISILGILKSGCAYLPLPKDISSDRESYILEDSGSRLLLTDSSRMFDYTNYEGTIFALDVEFESDRYDSSQLDEISLESSDLAYVIYTSGSTGVPKGVLIEHGSLLNYSYWARSYYLGGDIHSFGLFTPLSFDLTVTSLFLPLLSGGSLRVYPDSSDVSGLLRAYIEGGLSVIKLTPAHVMLLGVMDLKAPTLKIAIVGGDELQQQHIDILLSINKDIIIYNEYGPTEATVGCTVSRIISGVLIDIGKPISNTEVLILDGNNNLVAPGISGELCVSGPCLARGYLNREALMAEKFQAHPYKEGTRLYKTGDVGYWLPDGRIVYQGRKDGQIKIRGYRVELGEISHQLMTHPQIDDCVIDTLPNEGSDIDLVAYIVSDTSITSQELRNYLSRKLPEYMLPHYYVVIEDIPLTSNGKVDRSALPEVTSASLSSGVDYLAPVTTEERALVFVCEQVLKREGIGVSDNFYNLGGDSIKSIQISSRLRQQGYTLKVGDILATPVLSSLALCMVHGTREIDQSLSEGSVDLTPIQHFFFASDDIVVKSHYNQSVLLRSEDSLSRDALSHSISDLVKHHDALRLVYMYSEGLWKQSFKEFSSDSYSIEYYDLRDSEDELSALKDLGEALQGSFDLEEGPLFKVGHFRLSDGDRLALIAHHLMVDGVSWRILLEDLSILYEGYNAGNRVELALKTDSFQRWSRQQVLYAKSSEMSNERMYWEGILNESLVSLPVDMAGSQTGVLDRQLSFILSSGDTNLLQTEVHGVYGTEINDILLTGLGLALREVFGIDTSVLKMEGHGREDILSDIDISRTVGWFTSVYPHVLSVGSGDLRSVLVDVKEGLRQVPNKGIGYGMLKYQSEEGFDQDVRMDIGFNYLGDFGSGVEGREEESENPMMFAYSGDSIGASIAIENEDDILLSVTGMMVSGQLKMTVNYSSSIYKDTTINSLVSSYQEHLTVLIEELSSETKHYLTPSDLTFKGLTNQELEVINTDGQLEDVYELSPAQKGMYYHWLTSESSSLYSNQMSYRLRWPNLNIHFVQEAYEELVSRHSVLRTSFSSKYADNLLQIVKKEVSIDFLYKELDRNTEIDVFTYVAEQKLWDREQGFDLESGSQMRLIVLDLGSDTYEFIWSHHHILMDGWCVSILINEFYQILQSKIHGTTIDLPFPKPYSDYIKWLSDVGEETSLSYWKEYLSGYSEVTSVPFSEYSYQQSYEQKTETLLIEEGVYEGLNKTCMELGVTQSTFIQSAWGYLLSRYNGTRDVVFGTVVSGRPSDLEGVEDMVGLFMNTIPVRVSYQKEDKVEDLLRRAQASAIEGTPHHYVNLAQVQSQSDLGKGLLDHIMVFENFPINELIEKDIEGIDSGQNNKVEIKELDTKEQINYDFGIIINFLESSISIEIQYDSNKYKSSSITSILSHLQNLIDQFISDRKKQLNLIDYISEAEENELLRKNDKSISIINTKSNILDLFSDQVNKTPEAIAIKFQKEKLTYKELDEYSNQLANYLVEKGVSTETMVGICLDRSIEMIIGVFGILKAGGAYVPIDPDYPEERRDYMISDADIDIIVCTSDVSSFFSKKTELEIVRIDNDWSDISKRSTSNPLVEISQNDLAYIIYTSGSTGKPKGVMIEHKNVVQLFENSATSLYDFNDKDVWTLFHSFCFDVSVWEMFGALLYGGCLIVIPKEMTKDHKAFQKLLIEEKVSILNQTPSSFYVLQETLNLDMHSLSLRYVIFAGEALNPFKLGYWKQNNPQCKLINMYGITETTVHVTYKELGDREIETIISNVGNPISSLQAYILDDNHRLCPKGIIGELAISGLGLARGYLNRPKLTDMKFISNPYKEGKIYLSGDLARFLPNGDIEYMGRKDNQVKIRGYRMELGEIEIQLESLAIVKQAIVLAKKIEGELTLVAYIIGENKLEKNSILKELYDKLPDYMIPKIYIQLDEFPLTSNGKVDRKKMPDVTDNDKKAQKYLSPTTEIEIQLVSIWEDILNLEKIGILENFFDLGGHSLKAIQLVTRIEKLLNVKIEMETLFNSPTIQSLGKELENIIWSNSDLPESEENRDVENFVI